MYVVDQRRNMIKKTIIIFSLIIVIIILIFSNYGDDRTRVYDCGMAEWHPDIPKQVKEECRRLRYEIWLKEQQEARNRAII